jgi:small subunit ribosomal protein S6
MKNVYELTLLLKTGASGKDVDGVIEDIKKQIKEDGKIIKDDDLGKRMLAYRIAKEKEANFRLLTLEMQGALLSVLSTKLGMNDSVLRHMFVRAEKVKKAKKTKKKE